MKGLLYSLILIVLLSTIEAFAQVNPSDILLLRRSSGGGNDLDLDRYKVRPKENQVTKKENPIENQRKPQKFIESTDISPDASTNETTKIQKSEENNSEQIQESEKSHSQKIDLKNLQQYKSILSTNDKRKNILEFSLGPGYIYQNSSSRYWSRNYFSSSPAMDASLAMWLSPFLGIRASYLTSLNAQIISSPTGLEQIEVDHSWFQAGLHFRKYFGINKKAKSLDFGLGFYEYQFEVPSDSVQRMALQSRGLQLSLETELPSANTESWIIGLELMPSLSHKENTKTSNIESGDDNTSSAVGLWFGQKIYFDRKNQIYWKLHHRIEKSNFTGDTSVADPLLKNNITGNAVTNSTTFLKLGFTFGR
ncbi:MAG: hypothetical protein KDD58_01430 [Bdellovibrionales bacterium]|nr:hypothetical protein [Bdellovibrionales bacterium]